MFLTLRAAFTMQLIMQASLKFFKWDAAAASNHQAPQGHLLHVDFSSLNLIFFRL